MNAAFRRGEALVRLEDLSVVIVTHLALSVWFPHHPAQNHWQTELSAFRKALARYNHSKMKKSKNYTPQLVVDALTVQIDSDDQKDNIVLLVEAHGVEVGDSPDWSAVEKAISSFAVEVSR